MMLLLSQSGHKHQNRHRFKYEDSTFADLGDNLWIGGAPSPLAPVGKYFDGLVLCANEYQCPGCFPGSQTIQAPLRDDGSAMTREEQITAAKTTGKVIKLLNNGLRVLVTCYAGRNRSGLVCAMVLCKGPRQMGVEDAINLIRSARGPHALSNQDFVNFLRAFCG